MVDALGNCLRLVLTLGQQADCLQLPGLLAALLTAPGAVVAGKAYDTNAVLNAVAACGAVPVIPARNLRKHSRRHDSNLYADHNKAERFFGRLKEARGFVTRYEKTASSFLALAHLLAALDWMRWLSTLSRGQSKIRCPLSCLKSKLLLNEGEYFGGIPILLASTTGPKTRLKFR